MQLCTTFLQKKRFISPKRSCENCKCFDLSAIFGETKTTITDISWTKKKKLEIKFKSTAERNVPTDKQTAFISFKKQETFKQNYN